MTDRLVWEHSGDSRLVGLIKLEHVQQLAIDSGYVFENAGPELPLGRRANLPGEPPAPPAAARTLCLAGSNHRPSCPRPLLPAALFAAYEVNSLSAFIRLFNSTPLLPPWELGAHKGRAGKGTKPPAAALPAPTQPAPQQAAAGWAVVEGDTEVYVGQLREGERHGIGVLLTRVGPTICGRHSACFLLSLPPSPVGKPRQHGCGSTPHHWLHMRLFVSSFPHARAGAPSAQLSSAPLSACPPPQGPSSTVLYIGGFAGGKRQGLGEVLTSRGEAYQGSFQDDLMWGPGGLLNLANLHCAIN